MKKIALTGGFGTGKSTVGRMFEDLGLPRIDADILSHEVILPQTPSWREIVAEFGESLLQPDGQIDRKKLGELVFHDPAIRKRLEAIIHPRVRQAMHAALEGLEKKGLSKVLLDIPLLFEVGWDRSEKWDAIIVVTADEKIQIERARKKFGLSEAETHLRLKAQLPLAEKIKKAVYVIDNNGDVQKTRAQVEAIFKKL